MTTYYLSKSKIMAGLHGSLGDVQDGSAAGTAYLQLINPETDPFERQRLVSELLAYCEHDTFAMVELVKYLSR